MEKKKKRARNNKIITGSTCNSGASLELGLMVYFVKRKDGVFVDFC